jgi:PiT family inorganic phosphate transporter
MIPIVYIVGLALSFYLAWCLGANDAANPTDCAVGSGVISLKRALALFAIFASLGALLQGFMVMKTIDRGIVPRVDMVGAFTITLATCIWLTLCTWKGMPVSTTHSLIGAVLGYGFVTYGIGGIRWDVSKIVFLSMIASPTLSLLLASGIYRVIVLTFRKFDATSASAEPASVEKLIKWLLLGSLCFSAYAFGANDIANATGVFVTATSEIGEIPSSSSMLLLALFGSFGIALGGFTWGYRVIETSARRVTRLTPLTGLSAELSNASSVYLFTTVPYALFGWGVPVSTTHSTIGSIIGVGIAGGGSVDRATVARIIAAWALTLPAAAILSIILNRATLTFI